MTMIRNIHSKYDQGTRWFVILLSLLLFGMVAFFLVITSPTSQAAELESVEKSNDLFVQETPNDITLPDHIVTPTEQQGSTAESSIMPNGENDSLDAEQDDAMISAASKAEQTNLAIEEKHSQASDAPQNQPMDSRDTNVNTPAIYEQQALNERPAAVSVPIPIIESPQSPCTLKIFGKEIPYIYSHNTVSAPSRGCGIWQGIDDINDGDYTYFIGHNPGDFYNVMKLQNGHIITLCDGNGNTREYTVHDTFVVLQSATFQDIQERIEGHGESIVLQTCCGDNVHVRVVVAY